MKEKVRHSHFLIGLLVAMGLLAACTHQPWKQDPDVQATKRDCTGLAEGERYACIEQHAVDRLNPNVCRLAGMWIDDMCLQAVYQAADDPTICDQLYLEGVRPTCRAYYSARLQATTSPGAWPTLIPQPETPLASMSVTVHSLDEAQALVSFPLLVPDPATLLPGMAFVGAEVCPPIREQKAVALTYQGNGLDLSLQQITLPAPLAPPNQPHRTVSVHSHTGWLVTLPTAPDLHSLVWEEDGRSISLSGNLPPEVLIQIAEGLRPLNQTLPTPMGCPTLALAPGTTAEIDCADIYPGLPGCLRDEPLVGGRLAFVTERLPFGRTTILDLEHGEAWTLSPITLFEWSPSGNHLLAGRSIVYRYDGVAMSSFYNRPAFWAPLDALPGAHDWLAMHTADGALLVAPFPKGETRQILPPDSLGNNGRGTVRWSLDGWLAWSLNADQLAEAGQFEQMLYVRSAEGDAEVTAWRLSDDIREAYYQIVDWMPGTRLILAARGMLAVSLWSWGVPLVTINADTGEITDLGAAMLLTPEAYAWHPTQPGLLALAEGGSRYLFETGRLILLDVTTGEIRTLTGPDVAAFEPAWSPDGTLLAYAAVPASPDAAGDGDTLEHTLDGRAIYVANPQSGETHVVTHPGDAVDGWPQWSTDGTHLLYTRQHDGYTDVRVVSLDGSSDELLVTGLADPGCYYGGCGWRQMVAYYSGP